MSQLERGQLTGTAAEIYEEFFVPALFAEWAGRVADAVHVQTGQTVLDVACGTGIVARTMAQRVGASGKVIGLDINDGMLAVARQKAPDIEWRKGDALDLPFEDDAFDAVVNQFAMMFYTDRVQAVKEMYRVLKPDHTMAVAVWDTLDNTPGYKALEGLLLRMFGESYADGLRAPFNLGDIDLLTSVFEQAGLPSPLVTTITGKARFPSLDAWMYTEIKGWVLADVMSDDEFEQLLAEAPSALRQFVKYDGSVEFASPAHIVSVTK